MKNRGLRGLRVAYVTCSPWLVTLLFYSSQDLGAQGGHLQ